MKYNLEIMEKIKDILLECKGPKNAMASSAIAKLVDIEPGASNVKIRQYIREVMKKYRLPLGSHGRGFYIVETQEELLRNVRTLQSRMDEIYSRMIDLVRFYEKLYGEEK